MVEESESRKSPLPRQSNGVATWGPKLFIAVLVGSFAFFWWLLIHSGGVVVHHG